VVTGGADTFGPGEYQGTALEGLLPVRSNPPEEEIPGLALVLVVVVDRSVSMSFRGTDMDVNKFSMAKAAAVQAVRLLEVGDQGEQPGGRRGGGSGGGIGG
jgi:Ca-activated chloride channel family protein